MTAAMKSSSTLKNVSLLALGLSALTMAGLWAISAKASQRDAFVTAEAALKAGEPIDYNHLESYPLYPYLEYLTINQQLDTLPVAKVHRFLQRYHHTPLADRLQSQWLKQLAASKQWHQLKKDYKKTKNTTLNCLYRQALLHTGNTDKALHKISGLWLRGYSLPTACDPVFRAWKARGGMTPWQIQHRFHKALANGEIQLANYLLGLLPTEHQQKKRLWLAAHNTPDIILDTAKFQADNAEHRKIILYGLKRWSSRDSVSASTAFDRLKTTGYLKGSDADAMEKRIAVFLAARNHPDARSRLDTLPPQIIDRSAREWRVRLALRQQDWPRVLRQIRRLSSPERNEPRWIYWKGRALQAMGQSPAARRLYQKIAGKREYYGFLAANQLGRPHTFSHRPTPVSTKTIKQIANLPGIQRARELLALGRLTDARSEWNRALYKADRKRLIAAAHLAHQWQWHNRVIRSLAKAGIWNDLELRFPTPFRQQVDASAQRENIDPAWVYAIMRQESLFQSDARSPVGALGLMQIMPATGRHIADTLPDNWQGNATLLNPDSNIRFGSHYLARLLNTLQGNPVLASAAYNAGPHNVKKWLPEDHTVPIDIWAETIPFHETRKYVQRVMEYATVYSHRLQADNPFRLVNYQKVIHSGK